MRQLAWAVGAPVAFVIVAYLALVVVNWNDEPPSADAERLVTMKRDRPLLADAANGYIHAQGLAAAMDADNRAARSPEVAALANACGEVSTCAEALRTDPEALAQWLASEPWLLERYRRMLATEGWQEPIPADITVPLAGYQHAMEAQKLHLLAVRQQALAGDQAAVRDLLERDLVFWRQVLASSDLLVSKMVAAAAVRRHFAFGNLALRELPPDLAGAAVPPSWRQPLTVAERSLARSLGGEWHVISGSLGMVMPPDAVWDVTDRLLHPLYQPQATLNLFAARVVRLGTLSQLPYPELGHVLEGLAEPQDDAPLSLRLYNPVGTILDSMAEPTYANYIARSADLEGQRRAALLVATLRGDGIQHEGAAAAVRAARLRSPYDGAPLEWDAARGAIVFRGLEQGDRGRHAVLF